MGAVIVGKLLPTCQFLLNITELTGSYFGESFLPVLGPQDNSMQ